MRSSFPFLFLLPITLAASFSNPFSRRASAVACNNSPDLCDRSYSNITQLGAHDSPFLRDASTGNTDSGNQFYNSTIQLNAGVRLLTAQVYNVNGSWHLCHTSCLLLDAGTLSSWLTEIKTWMDGNPNDVVTILLVNSDNASAGDLDSQFEAANITSYAYIPPSTTTAMSIWPTLNTLILNSTRLVTFIASLDPTSNTVAPYLLDEFTFVFENPYDVTSPLNFSCVADRPPAVQGYTATALESGRMPLMNHFLDTQESFGIEVPDVTNITMTNAPAGPVGNLGSAAVNCTTQYGRAPTFILVDFFDQGPAISTVDKLNNIAALGRTLPSGTTAQPNATSGSARNITMFSGLFRIQHDCQTVFIFFGVTLSLTRLLF